MKWPNILKASHGLTDGLFIHCYVCRVRVVHKNISVCRAVGTVGGKEGNQPQNHCIQVAQEYLAYFLSKKIKNLFSIKEILCNFLVQTLQCFEKEIDIFLANENMKKTASKVAHNQPKFIFHYCQPAQNQPNSHVLFYKNGSLQDFYIKTLIIPILRFSQNRAKTFSIKMPCPLRNSGLPTALRMSMPGSSRDL